MDGIVRTRRYGLMIQSQQGEVYSSSDVIKYKFHLKEIPITDCTIMATLYFPPQFEKRCEWLQLLAVSWRQCYSPQIFLFYKPAPANSTQLSNLKFNCEV